VQIDIVMKINYKIVHNIVYATILGQFLCIVNEVKHIVKQDGNSGCIYLPKALINKQIRINLVEEVSK
jgi:hypothetical protein